MKMTTRAHLEYGFTAYTGVVWTDYQVDMYNKYQNRINTYTRDGLNPPQSLLNASHKLFDMYSLIK